MENLGESEKDESSDELETFEEFDEPWQCLAELMARANTLAQSTYVINPQKAQKNQELLGKTVRDRIFQTRVHGL